MLACFACMRGAVAVAVFLVWFGLAVGGGEGWIGHITSHHSTLHGNLGYVVLFYAMAIYCSLVMG